MDSGVAAFLGAVLGGVISGLFTWGMTYWRDRVIAKNWAIAVAGEVSAVAEMVRRRQWIEVVSDIALAAKERQVVGAFTVHLPDETLSVSRRAMEHVGLLNGLLPSMVPRVVTICDGIIADIRRLANFPIDHPQGMIFSSLPAACHDTHAELLGLLLEGLSVCDGIVDETCKLYPECAISKWPQSRSEQAMRGLAVPTTPKAKETAD